MAAKQQAHSPAGQPDPDSMTRPFQLTRSMHRDVYPAIDPKQNSALNAQGKVVMVTGAAGGLGYATVHAWAAAGAAGIILLGRNKTALEEVAASIPDTAIHIAPANLTNPSSVEQAFKSSLARFQHIDVVIHTAATFGHFAVIGAGDPNGWWNEYDINVRGSYNLAHYFAQALNSTTNESTTRGADKPQPTLVLVTSLAARANEPAGLSSYTGSKLAVIKLGEALHVELPHLRTFSVHPGMVIARDGRGMAPPPPLAPFVKDTPELFANSSLYLALETEKSDALRGGYLSVNWDLEECAAHSEEIRQGGLNHLAFLNGQLGPEGYPWGGKGDLSC